MECPTKLFYTGKKEYLDKKMDDPFLAALANGGYQVGELAKLYHPDGHNISSLDYEEAETQTKKLMQQDKAVLFEPAIRFNDLFIRVDILIKEGKHLKLIEVKSKSYDKTETSPFLTKEDEIRKPWKPYLFDVAFQKFVLSKAYPEYTIESFLMLVDKTAVCQTDGLNQKFKIVKDENDRKNVKVCTSLTEEDLANELLISVPVGEYVQMIFDGLGGDDIFGKGFEPAVDYLAEHYKKDERIPTPLGAKCAKCEFQCTKKEEAKGFKSGFKECWRRALNWKDEDFEQQSVLDLWNSKSKDKFIQQYKYKLSDLDETDIEPKDDGKPGLSGKERQWLQVQKEKEKDAKPYIDIDGLKAEMETWNFPLHFIDFETSMPAIPFHKGFRPYQGIAFQYSHHMVHKDGTIEHAGQYLNVEPGMMPNFDFIRHLKAELDKDDGTIFRYAPHENTYLNYIYEQLINSHEIEKDELCEFIQLISKSKEKSKYQWKGDRCMIDLLYLVKRYYYDPHTRGSNSLKYVLPAILNSSEFLQNKYSKPIYGSEIRSLNFKDWTWIQFNDGAVLDPYKLLPKVFLDASDKNEDLLFDEDELNNGGLAMTAYCMMQFTEMNQSEKQALTKALLQYCELDTFAMVLVYEYWLKSINS